MGDFIKNKVKSKIKSIVISALISALPVIAVIAVGAGVIAAFGFFFGLKNAGIKNVEYCTIDQLIGYCDDKDIITGKMLDEMMIGRSSLKNLLIAVRDANKEIENTTFSVSVGSKVHYLDENGKEQVTDGSAKQVTLWATDVGRAYALDWQPLYLAVVMDALKADAASDEHGVADATDVFEPAMELVSHGFGMGAITASAQTLSFDGADKVLKGNSNVDKCWNYFKAKGLNDIAVAAIVGNLQQESSSAINPKADNGIGFHGIAQWGGSRFTALKAFAKKRNASWEDLKLQLDFCWSELCGNYKGVLTYMKSAKILEYNNNATYKGGTVWFWARHYEKCTDDRQKYGIQAYDGRYNYSVAAYKKYSGKGDAVFSEVALDTEDDVAGVSATVSLNIGTWNEKGTRIILSESDIDQLISDFAPKFTWCITDGSSFTFKEAKNTAGSKKKTSGTLDSPSGMEVWYEPTYFFESAQLCFADVFAKNDTVEVYTNTNRWLSKITAYTDSYSKEEFEILIDTLPGGWACREHYQNIVSSAVGESTITSVGSGTSEVGVAAGTYAPLKNIKASIDIPENCGGMSMPLLLQTDDRWKNIPFGGGNIGSSGCSITSLSMVFSYLLNRSIYPDTLRTWAGNTYYVPNAGQSWSIMGAAANKWGVNCKQYTCSANKIRRALKRGKPVIVSTTAANGTSTGEFTSGNHFIALRGLTENGRVLVNDPNDSAAKRHYAKSYTAEFIVKECTRKDGSVKGMWVFSNKETKKK